MSSKDISQLAIIIVMGVVIICCCCIGFVICYKENKENKEWASWVREKKRGEPV